MAASFKKSRLKSTCFSMHNAKGSGIFLFSCFRTRFLGWFFACFLLRLCRRNKLRLFLFAFHVAFLVLSLNRLQVWSCLVVFHVAGWAGMGELRLCMLKPHRRQCRIWADFCVAQRQPSFFSRSIRALQQTIWGHT
jgi:hypothetical protein